MSDETKLITEPSALAGADAKALVDELSAVMRKHGMLLTVSSEAHPFVLAKIIDADKNTALALAIVHTIHPEFVKWQKSDLLQPRFDKQVTH